MKLLSVAVPCYNSQNYMNKCIDSILSGGNDIEIIIINDGSTDDTAKIADEYQRKYPDIIKVIHQENGGHGEGVNQGVLNSTGLYFKVVDSDDWLDEDALREFLKRIKSDMSEDSLPDMYICNYVYEHSADNSTYTMSYKNRFPNKRIFGWDDMNKFGPTQYLMMHSVAYRTKFLQKNYIMLPKHTFYVDNLYMYRPLPYAKTISYIDLDLYRYFIGREDQSITEKSMISRLDQQFKVTEMMVESHKIENFKKSNKNLYTYMLHHLAIMMLINAAFSFLSDDKSKIDKFYKIWEDIKQNNPHLYKALKHKSLAMFTLLPGKAGRYIYIKFYRIAKHFIKFG